MRLIHKRLASLLTLTLVGGGAVALAFWQTEHSEQKEKAAAEAAKVLQLSSPSAVRELVLTSKKGTLTLARAGDAEGKSAWTITAPVQAAAEGDSVDALVQQLVDLRRTAVVGAGADKGEESGKDRPTSPVDLALYGLAPARLSLAITDAKGKTETLLAGKKSAFDGSLYVKLAEAPSVYVVAGALEYQLDKDLFQLRDKRLLAFDAEDVMSVHVQHGAVRYALEREGERYRLIEPKVWPADAVAVHALLSALASANAKAFVSESATPEQLKAFGLTKPALQVALALKTGAPKRLLFAVAPGVADKASDPKIKAGESKAEKKYYAMVAGGGTAAGAGSSAGAAAAAPIIELAGNWLIEKLAVSPDDLRDKHVLSFTREDVAKITIKKGATTIALAREKEGDNQTWKLTLPEAGRAQDAEATSLVYRLWNMKAKRIVVEAAKAADLQTHGLATPELTVELAKSDNTLVGTYAFGAIVKDEQFVTATPGSRIEVVDKSVVDEIAVDPAKYR